MTICRVSFALLLTLKLCGVIACSWWMVCAPLGVFFILVLLIALLKANQ
jgi:hypothetical protein